MLWYQRLGTQAAPAPASSSSSYTFFEMWMWCDVKWICVIKICSYMLLKRYLVVIYSLFFSFLFNSQASFVNRYRSGTGTGRRQQLIGKKAYNMRDSINFIFLLQSNLFSIHFTLSAVRSISWIVWVCSLVNFCMWIVKMNGTLGSRSSVIKGMKQIQFSSCLKHFGGRIVRIWYEVCVQERKMWVHKNMFKYAQFLTDSHWKTFDLTWQYAEHEHLSLAQKRW